MDKFQEYTFPSVLFLTAETMIQSLSRPWNLSTVLISITFSIPVLIEESSRLTCCLYGVMTPICELWIPS